MNQVFDRCLPSRWCGGPRAWAIALLFAATSSGQQTWPMWMQSVVPDSGIPQQASVRTSHLAVADAAIYAFWGVDDPTHLMLWSRSIDHGRTWSPLAPFRPANQPVRGIPTRVFASGTDVMVHWDENSAAGARSLLALSSDRGTTWVVRPGPLHFGPTCLLEEGGTILWCSGPWLFSSVDRGVSWQGPRAIGAVGTHIGPVDNLVVRLQDGVLHVAWLEWDSAGSQAYYARSTDLGATWQPDGRALGAAPGALGLEDLIVTPNAAILVWRETSGFFVDRSLDAGLTWLPAPSLVTTLPSSANPTFASDGESLIAVWEDHPVSGPYRARCVRSPDHGRTWPAAPPADILTIQYAGRYVGITDVHSEDGWLAVTVRHLDRTWIPYTTYYYRMASKDGGATWSGGGGSIWFCRGKAVLATVRGFLCGIWQNEIPFAPIGSGDYQFDWFAGPRPLGGSAAGAGGRAPVLTLDGIPVFGFDSALQLRDGLHGAPAVLTFGTSRPPVPFLGGQLVMDPIAHLFVVLGGPASVTPGGVTQTFRMTYGVPSEFCWQAFVLDPAAVGGVAMSEGIEVRIF